MIKIYWI